MEQYIPIITKKYVRKINLEDVLYIKTKDRRVVVKTGNDQYIQYSKIEDFKPLLSDNFYFPLKKLCINLDKIKELSGQEVYFENGDFLHLGKESYARLKKALTEHFKKYMKKN